MKNLPYCCIYYDLTPQALRWLGANPPSGDCCIFFSSPCRSNYQDSGLEIFRIDQPVHSEIVPLPTRMACGLLRNHQDQRPEGPLRLRHRGQPVLSGDSFFRSEQHLPRPRVHHPLRIDRQGSGYGTPQTRPDQPAAAKISA